MNLRGANTARAQIYKMYTVYTVIQVKRPEIASCWQVQVLANKAQGSNPC